MAFLSTRVERRVCRREGLPRLTRDETDQAALPTATVMALAIVSSLWIGGRNECVETLSSLIAGTSAHAVICSTSLNHQPGLSTFPSAKHPTPLVKLSLSQSTGGLVTPTITAANSTPPDEAVAGVDFAVQRDDILGFLDGQGKAFLSPRAATRTQASASTSASTVFVIGGIFPSGPPAAAFCRTTRNGRRSQMMFVQSRLR
ncbi:hypothetical protein CABS03_13998 [Colletotrichum abscissum]|uniref:Uncharacterized protein n=1 Tax=Colletotrichum abscissum TaxID=1671311 RepID=A0A9P9X3Y6_9PEZI|nr:hypothetical protein CABS02_12913 [Colletotrichum abscissum]